MTSTMILRYADSKGVHTERHEDSDVLEERIDELFKQNVLSVSTWDEDGHSAWVEVVIR